MDDEIRRSNGNDDSHENMTMIHYDPEKEEDSTTNHGADTAVSGAALGISTNNLTDSTDNDFLSQDHHQDRHKRQQEQEHPQDANDDATSTRGQENKIIPFGQETCADERQQDQKRILLVVEQQDESSSAQELQRSLPDSPHAMAEAAYNAGVQSRKKRDLELLLAASSSSDKRNDTAAVAENTGSSLSSSILFPARSESRRVEKNNRQEEHLLHQGGEIVVDDIEANMPLNKRRCLTTSVNNKNGKQDVVQNSLGSQHHADGLEATMKILQDLWRTNTTNRQQPMPNGGTNNNSSSSLNSAPISQDAKWALEKTKNLLFQEMDTFIRAGLKAFYERDELRLEVSHYKELYESTSREIQRLKSSEESSRVSLSNLLKAVETSKASARDAARAAQTEARLRGEVSDLRSERDTAIGEHGEARRRVGLLEEEVRLLKSRIAKLTQEKIKVERDARAALSLARSMDSHAADDVEYYKRRMSDLNDHLQSKNAEIAELKHQLDGFRRQKMERSFSHNRFSQLRFDGID